MTAFENRFGFSFSQHRRFRSCERRWWLEKIQSWEGWNRNAPDLARFAYRGKYMTSVYGQAGKVVHEVAELAVKGAGIQRAVERYKALMRSGWRQAKVEAQSNFSSRPKHRTNMFELYYANHGIEDLERFARSAFDRGLGCVESIFESDAYEGARRGDIVEVEELHQLHIDEIPVWVVVDLAFKDDAGDLWIWDWKTGRPSDNDRDQLALYALYATEVLGFELGKVKTGLAYLLDGVDEVVTVSRADIDRVRSRVASAATEIQQRLNKPGINEAPASRFPKTDDESKCQRCEMFFACKGHRDLSQPGHTLGAFRRGEKA